MKKLKLKTLIASIVFTLLVPVSSFASTGVEYGAGEWDYLSSEFLFQIPTTLPGERSNNYSSGGGNMKLEVEGANGWMRVTIMEYDPDNADDVIGYDWIPGNGTYVYSVDNYVDGEKAEVYFQFGGSDQPNGDDIRIYVWD